MYSNFILWTLGISLLQIPPVPPVEPSPSSPPSPAPMQMPPEHPPHPLRQAQEGAPPMQMPPSHPMRMQPSEGFEGVPMPEGHPSFEREAPGRVVDLPDVVSRLDQTEGLREAPKTFEVALAIASEYANANRAEEAAFYFGQAFEKTAELRALFEKLKGEKAGEACEEVNEGKELELEFAKAKAQKPRAKQAACVRLLLPRVVDAGKKSATFQMLSKDLEGAKKTWEVLLVLDNTLLEASYALGVLLLETEGDNLASLGRSQKLLQGVAGAGHPRASQARGILRRVEAALEAGGNSKVQRPRSEAFMPAGLGFTLPEVAPPSEAEVLKEAERLLAQKQYAQAINRYLGLVDGNQRSARVDAGMAFALARLGTQGEMAQKVWEAAEQTPEVLDGLAQTLKAGGDAEGARWIWGKLSTHPTFGVVARERLKTASP